MQALYDLKDMLCKELEEYSNGDLSAGKLDIIDKLAHAVKSLETIIAMNEASDSSGRYDGSGRYDESGRYESGRSRYSNARGRGRNARRDSMGRYASRGSYNNGSYNGSYNSYDDGMVDELREIMDNVTDERKRQEFQKFINKFEQM